MTTLGADQPIRDLPGRPVPYVIEAGSGRAHVLLGEVGRALVGAEESNGQMSVMSLDGPKAERPIPLHYHDSEYEFFFVLRGAIQLWADEESRVLYPGDFGFIPPGTLHAYQLRGHYSTFVGPVVPGGWDRFFDLYVQGNMQPAVNHALRPEGMGDAYGAEQGRKNLHVAYDWLESNLPQGDWAAGGQFSLADCAAAPALFYADWVEEIGPGRPRLAAYRMRLLAHPIVARVVDEARPYRRYFPLGAPDRD